jgi:CBS domain-containing protein
MKLTRACDVMTVRVAGIHPKATLGQAIGLMAAFELSGLPVIDISGVMVGMLTGGDLMRRARGREHDALLHDGGFTFGGNVDICMKTRDQTVEEVMTPALCAVQEDTAIAEVARLMKDRGIKRLPVLHGDKLVGIIHRSDLTRVLGADFDTERHDATPRDSAIKDTVLALLHCLQWTPCPLIDVVVASGHVELHGTLLKDQERNVLRAAIETIPGVVRYTDHLVLAEAQGDIFPPFAEDAARRQKLD